MAFTEMISANGLVRETKKSYRYLDSTPEDSPLGVQIFGSDSAILAEASRIAEAQGADLLDLNMGCPVKKVVKTGAGAALMRDPAKVKNILKSVRKATILPLTIKIRSGWTSCDLRAVELSSIAEDCGVDAIIIHPRTADQGFYGLADWTVIEAVKKNVGIPVIGSGDIKAPKDAFQMMNTTGCDGVMLARAVLGNPWIIRDIISCSNDEKDQPSYRVEERERVIRDHMEMEIRYSGESAGIKSFRKHLLWYIKGIRDSSQFRQKLATMQDKDLILKEVHNFFRCHRDETSGN
jgi:tRNA-dihydrouridine synthase B